MRSLSGNNISVQIIMEEFSENSFDVMDCFFDPDQDSEVFDDFFNNLEDANYNQLSLRSFGNEKQRWVL